jgi:hypothetical protein
MRASPSDGMTVETIDDRDGERMIVRAGSRSYTVRPANRSFTAGELDAAAALPAPTPRSNGSVVRFAPVHDGRWKYFLRSLADAAAIPEIDPGEYFTLADFGKGSHVETENRDPGLAVIQSDVTLMFLESSDRTQIEARIAIGPVFQRTLVDLCPERPWHDDNGPASVFISVDAPLVDTLTLREGSALLAAAGFRGLGEFQSTPATDTAVGLEQVAGGSAADCARVAIPGHLNELVDAFRLHGDARVQDECYRDLVAWAVEKAAAMPMIHPEPELSPEPLHA